MGSKKQWPDLDAFVGETLRRLASDDPGSFSSCVEPLQRLARSRFVSAFVDWELSALMDSRWSATTELRDAELTLVQDERFSLSLVLLEAGQRMPADQIEGLAHHLVLAVVGPDPLDIERYRLSPPARFEVLDRSRRLQPLNRDTLAPGDVGFFAAGEDVMRIHQPRGATAALLLRSDLIHRIRWVYDAATLSPCLAVAADPRSSRLDFACRIVAKLGEPCDARALEGLVAHPDHFVRWTALRTSLQLDAVRGRKLMEDALEDLHPHIRSAATRFFRDNPTT